MEPGVALDPAHVRWSAAVSGDRPLLVLLHGRGANEDDLFGLVPYLPASPVIASVRAPHREGPGFSWIPPRPADLLEPPPEDVDDAVRAVLDWLDGLGPTGSIGLLGFSQGAALSLQLLRTRPDHFAYVVQLSGFLLERDLPGDAELARIRPPVFSGRGSEDAVISAERVARTMAWLPGHSSAEIHEYKTGHSITETELGDLASFIERQLATAGS